MQKYAYYTQVLKEQLIPATGGMKGIDTAVAAGIAYLYGADEHLINHTVVNGLAILSGTICDGAKPSCASKIAMAVYSGLLGFEMARKGKQFYHGEGIVKKGVENTIEEIGVLSRKGMGVTNQVILDIMIKD